MPQCVITSCKNNTRKSNLTARVCCFRFPSNPFTCAEWISIVARERRDDFYKPSKNSVICSDHFGKSDTSGNIHRRRLVKTAVPKLKIQPPSNDPQLAAPNTKLSVSDVEVQNQDSTGSEIKVFCPKCNTEIPHTARGIQEDQKKIFIAKVYHYFEQEYEELKKMYGDLDLTPLSRFWQRTALATGVSETTVRQILQEEQEWNADKRQEPPKKRRTARKRCHQTDSSSEDDSSDDNVEHGGQSNFAQIAQKEPEIETLVVKIEPPEYYKEQPQTDPISVEVKAEPPDDELNNTTETLAPNEPAGTKRKGKKIQRTSDVTSTRQHTQGESSTAAAASSLRLTEQLHESGLLGESEVKLEKIEIEEEGFS